MAGDIERILREQADMNDRIGRLVKSINSEYSDAVSGEIEKLYANDAELEKSIDGLHEAAKSMETVIEALGEKIDALAQKMRYIEETNEKIAGDVDIMERRLSSAERLQDMNGMEEAVRKIKRE
ncbi:MAG: hypothetical protein HYT73_03385 [Candidatus Aenigmarchaeota archaeon]|nr:hypothetical protein [Candidatus Aenigmarchaeota archaeon]